MKSGKQRRHEIMARRAARAVRQARHVSTPPVWCRAPTAVCCEPERLAPHNSYGEPAFVTRGYYVDIAFRCRDCGAEGVWTAERQKWWYEIAQGNVWTRAVRCKTCRVRERERKATARATQQAGWAARQARLQH